MNARAVASKQMEISGFLQNYGPFKAKLDELLGWENEAILKLTSDAVHPADVDDLNKHILQKKAIERIYLLVEEMREDLHPDETSRE